MKGTCGQETELRKSQGRGGMRKMKTKSELKRFRKLKLIQKRSYLVNSCLTGPKKELEKERRKKGLIAQSCPTI